MSSRRLTQIIEQKLPITNDEHHHIRECPDCRSQWAASFSDYDARNKPHAPRRYFAPLAILVVLLIVSVVFLAVILQPR
jgi:hypothetical protein